MEVRRIEKSRNSCHFEAQNDGGGVILQELTAFFRSAIS
jgi:hypothetical protein